MADQGLFSSFAIGRDTPGSTGTNRKQPMKPDPSTSSGSSPPEPEFLTVDEAAALLRLNRKTLYESIRLGQVPGVVRVGRAIRIARAALGGAGLTPPRSDDLLARGNGSPAQGVVP